VIHRLGCQVARMADGSTGPMTLTPVLVVDQKAELGEGPFWHPGRQQLLWLDVLHGKVFCYDPAANTNAEHDFTELTEHITTVVPVQGSTSAVVVGTTEGMARFDLDEGVKSTEMHKTNGFLHGEHVRMNDGKCDPQGRLWLGSISRTGPGGADLLDGGAALYVYDGWEGSPHRAVEGITVSNGLSWNAEGTTMYYTDSPTFHVDVFDFDGNAKEGNALATNRRQAFQVSESFPPVPDGHALDTSGKLWVACFGVGEVRRYDPNTGEVLAVVKMPTDAGPETTACAFGGEALDELYITTAHEFWDAEKQQAHPLAGGLFKVPREELAKLDEGITGLPPHHFKM